MQLSATGEGGIVSLHNMWTAEGMPGGDCNTKDIGEMKMQYSDLNHKQADVKQRTLGGNWKIILFP